MTYETWKPIPGHPGYEVSDLGRVRSVDRLLTMKNGRVRFHRGRILKDQSNGPYNYRWVQLGQNTQRYVHRLVMLAFVEEPGDLEVDHVDGDTTNNRLSNLRYLSRAQNMTAPRERRPTCHKGHSYENAYWCPKGKRHCRVCRREADHRRRPPKRKQKQDR